MSTRQQKYEEELYKDFDYKYLLQTKVSLNTLLRKPPFFQSLGVAKGISDAPFCLLFF